MAGYSKTNPSPFVSSTQIQASHFNTEFTAIDAAMDASSGHTHNGSAGGGGPIAFASLASKPTTLAGYGITDGATDGENIALSIALG